MTGIEKIVNSPETVEMLRSVKAAVGDTRVLVKNIDKKIQPLAERMTEVAKDVEKLAQSLQSADGAADREHHQDL